jgi:hypothetical protein
MRPDLAAAVRIDNPGGDHVAGWCARCANGSCSSISAIT